MTSREAFEKWAALSHSDLSRDVDGYCDERTFFLWCAWKAATKECQAWMRHLGDCDLLDKLGPADSRCDCGLYDFLWGET